MKNKIKFGWHRDNLKKVLEINGWGASVYTGNLYNRVVRHLNHWAKDKFKLNEEDPTDLYWAMEDLETLRAMIYFFELKKDVIEKTIKSKKEV